MGKSNLAQLELLFDVLINNIDAGIWKAKGLYELELTKELNNFLAYPSLENVLRLSIGLKFWPSLMQASRTKKSKGSKYNKGIFLDKGEMKKIAKPLFSSFSKKEDQLIKLVSKKYTQKISHDQCLALIQQHNIALDDKIIQKIKLTNFGIDWKVGENGEDRGVTLSEDEAVEFLSVELASAVSKKALYEYNLLPLSYIFGIYIEKAYFEINEEYSLIQRSVNEIYDAINRNIVSRDYRCQFDGLIRLLTRYDLDPDDDYRTKQTIKQIRDGGEILISSSYPFLCIQPSLAQYILGMETYCRFGKNFDKLNSSSFRFRKEELVQFVNTYKREFPGAYGQHKSEKLQREREKSLDKVIQRIIDISIVNGIPINKNRMPGTKKEFISLIKKLDNQFRSFVDGTISDYFKRMKIKFKHGVRVGKCSEYNAIEKLVLEKVNSK